MLSENYLPNVCAEDAVLCFSCGLSRQRFVSEEHPYLVIHISFDRVVAPRDTLPVFCNFFIACVHVSSSWRPPYRAGSRPRTSWRRAPVRRLIVHQARRLGPGEGQGGPLLGVPRLFPYEGGTGRGAGPGRAGTAPLSNYSSCIRRADSALASARAARLRSPSPLLGRSEPGDAPRRRWSWPSRRGERRGCGGARRAGWGGGRWPRTSRPRPRMRDSGRGRPRPGSVGQRPPKPKQGDGRRGRG